MATKPYIITCRYCNKTFANSIPVSSHMGCLPKRKTKTSLNIHIRQKVMARDNLTCKKCGYSFAGSNKKFIIQKINGKKDSDLSNLRLVCLKCDATT